MIEEAKVVYENRWIMNRIYNVSDRIRNNVVDSTNFERRCIRKLVSYISPDESRIKHRRYIERLIQEEASDFVSRSYNQNQTLFTELISESDDGEEIEFEPMDVLADVESDLLAKEMIALLAQDDRRKITIMECWKDGNTNDSLIAEALARYIGGNSESHRKYIQRFRTICREELVAVI